MAIVAPAILAENQDDYKLRAERVHEFAQRVHLDIADGEFAPTFTIGAAELWWPQEWQVDIHAMVARPSEHVQALVAHKPAMIIFHAEVQEDLLPTLQYVKQAGIKVGVALLKPTVPSTVAQYIEAVDHVMIFSGDLGHHGGTASLMQLEKVRLVRNIRQDLEIGWDGGATVSNVFNLAQGGVDVVNVGGAIANAENPKAVYDTLVNEINKHGII